MPGTVELLCAPLKVGQFGQTNSHNVYLCLSLPELAGYFLIGGGRLDRTIFFSPSLSSSWRRFIVTEVTLNSSNKSDEIHVTPQLCFFWPC